MTISTTLTLSFMLLLLSAQCATNTFVPRKQDYANFSTTIPEDNEMDNLRYLAFGTSISWGFGLPIDPESGLRLSYVYLLSSKKDLVKNLAIRASDARYASICTQSMIGDGSIYDVIVIEYDRSYYFGLTTLLERLRKRFLQAIIIMTEIFRYEEIEVVDLNQNNNISGLKQYMTTHGYTKNNLQSRQFLKDQSEHLQFQFGPKTEHKHSYLEQLAYKYNASVYRWNTTTIEGQDMRDIVFHYLPFIGEDQVHLNLDGHQLLASGIKKVVQREMVKRSHSKSNFNNPLGTWGDGDHCVTWFDNGVIDYDNAGITRIEFDTRNTIDFPPIEQFDFKGTSTGKFALPFSTRTMINIENKFSDNRYLALAYMVMGPYECIYPRTVSAIHNNLNDIPTTDLNPLELKYKYPVHVIKTQTIGMLLPGINTIVINPLVHGFRKELAPFRLVGYSLSSHKIKLIGDFDYERGVAQN